MHNDYLSHARSIVDRIRADGFYKSERVIASPQSPHIRLANGSEVLNFCANNYLGLADDPRLIDAAKIGLDEHGFGMASVRFICGTQDVHKQLESAVAAFLHTDDAILYSSCFDANGGLFETLLEEQDAVISDNRHKERTGPNRKEVVLVKRCNLKSFLTRKKIRWTNNERSGPKSGDFGPLTCLGRQRH